MSVDAGKAMEHIEAQTYTDPEEPKKLTDRVVHKKWERKFINYDQIVKIGHRK